MSKFHDEFFQQKGPKHDELVIKCVSKDTIQLIINKAGFVGDNPFIVYETEVLCRNGTFIIGYADILIKVLTDVSDDLEKEISRRAHRLITDYRVPEAEAFRSARISLNDGRADSGFRVLVECKPTLDDVGAVLRQLKTYESILYKGYGTFKKVIATYSAPSEDVINYLSHEGVKVVTFA